MILALSDGFEILTPSLACRVRGSSDLLSILNSNLIFFLDEGWSNSKCFNNGLNGFLFIACLSCSMHLETAGRPVSYSYCELLPSSLHNLHSIMYPTPGVVQGLVDLMLQKFGSHCRWGTKVYVRAELGRGFCLQLIFLASCQVPPPP